jgi:hypothetical protein
MDAMRDALIKKKKDIEKSFKISIEIEPSDESEEKPEKIGMAPEVKDAEAPVEPTQVPEDEVKEGEAEVEIPLEQMKKGMVELPKGREPMTLSEKATALMMAKKKK